MKAILDWLSGKKSYIIAAATAVYGFGITVGWWPHNAAVDLMLGGGAVAALRAGMVNSQPEPPKP